MGSRRRKMMRLQEKARKEEARRKESNRRLVPGYKQRLKAIKMEGAATFVGPEEKEEEGE